MAKQKSPHIGLPSHKLAFSLALIFTLFVIWIQGSPLFPNGQIDQQGNLVFYDYVIFRDSAVHLSLINELQSRFPPANFAAAGEPLKNYHYFYDALLALMGKFLKVNLLDLYFRVYPVSLSLALCLVIFLSTLRLSKNLIVSSFSIFFTTMATSLGSITPEIKKLIEGRPVTGGNNIFMTDQIYNMMINPQGVASLIIFLLLFLLLNNYETSRKRINLFLFALLLGLSFGFKAYGGLTFLPAALAAGVWFILRLRDLYPFLAVIAGGGMMVGWIKSSIDSKVAGVSWAPLWLIEKMMIDLDRLNEPDFAIFKQYYESQRSWRWWLIFGRGIIIYIIGSLGLRTIAFIEILRRLGQFKDLMPSSVFIFSAALVSLIVPLLFNQTRKAFEIIQFTPYFTLVMGIFFTITLFQILKKRNIIIKTATLLIFVGLFLILARPDIERRFDISSETISFSSKEVEAINYVKARTSPSAIFLLPETYRNREYLWFSSLASRRTVYSGYRFAEQVGVSIAEREKAVHGAFSGETNLTFNYVYINKTEGVNFATIENNYHLLRVFENDEVVILRK